MASIHNIIVAAGSGTRFGAPLPKQFMLLGGRPVLMHTIDAFRAALPGASETLVLSETGLPCWEALCAEYEFRSPGVAIGGASRFDSVNNALSAVPDDAEIILVHDGARPFAERRMIRRIVEMLEESDVDGVIPVVRVTDSLRAVCAGGSEAVDREKLRAVQTPQAFRARLLIRAYEMAGRSDSFTDDASVMEAAGFRRLSLVDGASTNIKITNPVDLAVAHAILESLQN